MRDYGKVSPQFWVGETGKKIKAVGPECQVVALYLMSSPHANMLGLYYLPLVFLSHETGLPLEGASKALQSLIEVGFCSYDEGAEVIWVHEMAYYQIGEALKPNDNRVKGIISSLKNVPKNNHVSSWWARYADTFSLPESEAPSKPLRSQKQEQKEKQKEEQEQNDHGASEPDTPPPEKPRNDYPEEFEAIWQAYPKREGANPKNKAYSGYKARIAEGVKPETMAAGVARYAAFVRQKGKTGTEFVMQGQRFFGTEKAYENDWMITEATHENHQSTSGHTDRLSTVERATQAAERRRAEIRARMQSGDGECDGDAVGEDGTTVWGEMAPAIRHHG